MVMNHLFLCPPPSGRRSRQLATFRRRRTVVEGAIKEERVIKIGPAHQGDGLPASLPQGTHLWNPHGKKEKAFQPLAARHQPRTVKEADDFTVMPERLKILIGPQAIGGIFHRSFSRCHPVELMPARTYLKVQAVCRRSRRHCTSVSGLKSFTVQARSFDKIVGRHNKMITAAVKSHIHKNGPTVPAQSNTENEAVKIALFKPGAGSARSLNQIR